MGPDTSDGARHEGNGRTDAGLDRARGADLRVRPFFLGASVWAVVAMLSGFVVLPTSWAPASWHAHEFLFGYLGAVVAGFLLTAVPNWTGRLPIVGWPLGGLFALWLLARGLTSVSAYLPAWAVAVADLAMPVALALAIGREIVTGRNWRNAPVLGLLSVMILGNAVFHWEAAQGQYAAQGYGLRIGLGAALMMIAMVGGRVVPSFTRNWLVRQGSGKLPEPPMRPYDKVSLLLLLGAIVLWIAFPHQRLTGLALVIAGGVHLVRLVRWAGARTGAEPLVWVLHAGYLFVPLGAVWTGAELLISETTTAGAVQHLWMAGAIGVMTLAVMTRATLGHTGQALHAGTGTTALYLSLIAAVVTRIAAGFWPSQAGWLHSLSGRAWIAAFGGFALLYGPLLLRPAQRS